MAKIATTDPETKTTTSGDEPSGLPDTVVVDGRSYTREEAVRLLRINDTDRAAFTQATQKASVLEGRLEEQSRLIQDLQRRASTPAAPAKDDTPDFDKSHDELDRRLDAIDSLDPEGESKRRQIERERRELGKHEREYDRQQTRREIEAAQGRTDATLSAAEQRNAIKRRDDEVFEKSLQDEEITLGVEINDREKQALRRAYDGAVALEHGTYHKALRAFEHNPDAVRAAIQSVESVRQKVEAKRKALIREEVFRDLKSGHEAGRSTPGIGRTAPPSPTSEEEYVEVALWLNGQTTDAQRHYIADPKNKPFIEWYEKRAGMRK